MESEAYLPQLKSEPVTSGQPGPDIVRDPASVMISLDSIFQVRPSIWFVVQRGKQNLLFRT
jgi:hypothetical protein